MTNGNGDATSSPADTESARNSRIQIGVAVVAGLVACVGVWFTYRQLGPHDFTPELESSMRRSSAPAIRTTLPWIRERPGS